MAAVVMNKKDFYSEAEDSRAEILLNRMFPGERGVMVFESGNEVIVLPVIRFLGDYPWQWR